MFQQRAHGNKAHRKLCRSSHLLTWWLGLAVTALRTSTKLPWMNEWMKVQWFKVHSKARSRLSLTHLPCTTVEQSKNVRWSESPCSPSGSKGKGLWRKGFAEEPSLECRMKHWASKRRCKQWLWRWWTAMCDRRKCRRLCLRRARLVLGWMTVSGFNSRCGTFISVCDQPPRSTLPGHPFVGRRNEYQPKGGDVLRVGIVKAGTIRVWVAGKSVWSPCYTRTISERFRDKELIMLNGWICLHGVLD